MLAYVGQHASDSDHGSDECKTIAVLEGQLKPDYVAGNEVSSEKQEYAE